MGKKLIALLLVLVMLLSICSVTAFAAPYNSNSSICDVEADLFGGILMLHQIAKLLVDRAVDVMHLAKLSLLYPIEDVQTAAKTGAKVLGAVIVGHVICRLFKGCQPASPTDPEPVTYTVTYNANDATSGSVPAAQTKVEGVDLILATNTGNLAKDGWVFNGWNTMSDPGDEDGTHYDAGATYKNDEGIYLYAEWKEAPTTYTVTFDLNGITGTAPEAQVVNSGEKARPATLTDLSGTEIPVDWYYKNSSDELVLWNFDDVVTSDMVLYAKSSSCIAAGTMITMGDGEQKAVENLEIGDVIRTFDHETGKVSSAPVCFIWESKNVANAFTLTFEGGIEVTVVEEHGFYDQEEQKYAFINANNAKDYIGHHFYDADHNCWLELKSCEVLNGSVDAYAIITSGDLNHLSNGILSICDGTVKMLANVFEYDGQMKFDEGKKRADIEKYGLMSKEKILELEGFTESDYDDYNLQYLNVAIGKGLTSWERLEAFSDYCIANGI